MAHFGRVRYAVEMKVHTRASRAASAAARWREHYPNRYDKQHQQILALGPHPAPELVDAIVGNTTWTALTCDACCRDVGAVVDLLDDQDDPTHLCRDCLARGLHLIDDMPEDGRG